MKKNVLIKSFLILIVLALLTLVFVGCGGVIPTTGTVYIVVSGSWYYNIWMDYTQKFWGVAPGTYILYNVPIGNHFFEAVDTWGASWGYDYTTQYIHAGVNYVYLYP
ncbi:MAG: hypothetical protein Kow00103_14490 [Candidatus Caldatribacteriota bacterium]